MPRQRMTPFVLALALALPTAAVALPLVTAAPAHAQAQASAFVGTYTLNAHASDNVERAINEAGSHVMFLIRGIARSRMRSTNVAYRRVNIAETSNQFAITFDQRAAIHSPSNGTPVQWTREDGEKMQVSTHVVDGKLVQTFIPPDGRRVNTYSLSNDGKTLTMEVVVTSPKLPQPLHYRLVFDRV
ncbi:MAG TPA: hypothetical protein VFH27_07630 [Longimicrobiaceae bacterium]|nr:hypothetical protein [Longimicrobiaceae bacterium]